MKEFLFVYGTLKSLEIQKKIFGRVIPSELDFLGRFKKTKVMIGVEVYPCIVEDDKGSVAGQVLAVDSDELEKVDDYETSFYRRRKVRLKSGREAWVYVKS